MAALDLLVAIIILFLDSLIINNKIIMLNLTKFQRYYDVSVVIYIKFLYNF